MNLDLSVILASPQVQGLIRHVLGIAAGFLVGHGLLVAGQTTAFIEVFTSIIMGAIPLIWSWAKNGELAKLRLFAKVRQTPKP